MNFWEAVRTCLFPKYFEFRGRASRSEYWWFQLFIWLSIAALTHFGGTGVSYAGIGVTAVPQLAVTVRRLHDTDRSAWWMLLSPPGWLIPDRFFDWLGWIGIVIFSVWGIASLVFFWFMVQKGDAWENRYGLDPVPDAVLGLRP